MASESTSHPASAAAPTSATRRGPREHWRAWIERAHGLVLLAPAAFLVWAGPGAVLADDPFPALTGTGIAALATILPASLLVTRRVAPRVRWIGLYLGFFAAGLASLRLLPPSDTLEASRATILAATALALLICGASQGREGRTWLVRGLVTLTFLALIPAVLDASHGFSGALGNTGSTSEVALLGAAAGAWLLARDDGPWRWIGACAAALYAFYVGLAPVLAGAVCFATVLALLFTAVRETRAMTAVLLGACALAFGAGRLIPHPPTPPSPRSVQSAPGDVGGFQVRKLVWATLPTMIADYGPLGAGPGQFRAAYPPYRDPREIEMSSHDRTLPRAETEVEHAHSDVLQAFVDTGYVGGVLWLAFLAAIGWRALSALRGGDPSLAALGAASLAVLGNAVLREPLLWNPASSAAAFAVFGALLAFDPEPTATTRARRWLAMFALGALGIQLARALTIAGHGGAIATYVRTGDRSAALLAGSLCDDSAIARMIAARELEASDGETPTRATLEAWESVLALRPHNVEALIQLGLAHARAGEADAARNNWMAAQRLDPEHPALHKNLARMEALIGDVDAALEHLRAQRLDERAALASYANTALRELNIERGWRLLARVDDRFDALQAETAHDFARSDKVELGEDLRLALEGSAHLTWARQHGESGDFANAVRSYRQAKRCFTPRGGGEAPRLVSLELAGALAASGKPDEAAQELDSIDATPIELVRLPTWAGQALLDARLLGR